MLYERIKDRLWSEGMDSDPCITAHVRVNARSLMQYHVDLYVTCTASCSEPNLNYIKAQCCARCRYLLSHYLACSLEFTRMPQRGPFSRDRDRSSRSNMQCHARHRLCGDSRAGNRSRRGTKVLGNMCLNYKATAWNDLSICLPLLRWNSVAVVPHIENVVEDAHLRYRRYW